MWQRLSGSFKSSTSSRSQRRLSTREGLNELTLKLVALYAEKRLVMPVGLVAELDKRKKGAEQKAKLCLQGCRMRDEDVAILVTAISQHKVLSKLDLRRNEFTDKGIGAVQDLLHEQMRFMEDTPIEQRMDDVLLGFVSFSSGFKEEVLKDIKFNADILATCNVIAALRLSFIKSGSPEPIIPAPTAAAIYLDVMGRPLKAVKEEGYDYDELQDAVLRSLISDNKLPVLGS
jgi:hypothetical protein